MEGGGGGGGGGNENKNKFEKLKANRSQSKERKLVPKCRWKNLLGVTNVDARVSCKNVIHKTDWLEVFSFNIQIYAYNLPVTNIMRTNKLVA